MGKIILSFLFLAASNTWAAPPAKDVNVVNTPTVTITNPQTSVTVDNSASNPVPVTIQGGVSVAPDPQFVGFSSDSVQGDAGLVGMHGACALTYTGARMCFDVEVFKTLNLQSVPSVPSGWIQSSAGAFPGDDCIGWSRVSGQGMVLSGERMNISLEEVTYPGGVAAFGEIKMQSNTPSSLLHVM